MMRTSRFVGAVVGLLLLAATPLAAQGFATPEYYAKEGREALASKYYTGAIVSFRQAATLRPQNAEYHFLLGTALASDRQWDEARAAFAKAVALQPDLAARVDQWMAGAPGAPGAPAAAPAPATPIPATPIPATPIPAAPARPAAPAALPGAFAVGDRVEVQYRAGEWIPGVVTMADPGACPYYRVRADAYGRGQPSELGYACGSVRAPTGVPEVRAACGGSNPNCPPKRPPPLGSYSCTEQVWQGPGANPQFRPKYHGSFTLLGGNRYRLFDDGAVGQYRYDPSTFRLQWRGGGMDGRGGVATFGLDGDTPEITVVFETAYTRRTGNAAPRWQCGLQ